MKIVLNRVIFYDVMINIEIPKKLKYFFTHSAFNSEQAIRRYYKQNGAEKYDICER
jgi:hypothetical protein